MQDRKGVWRRGSTAPRLLNLDTVWEVSGQLHAPAALPLRKFTPASTEQKTEPYSLSARFGKKKPLGRDRTPIPQSPVR
jgi:hypothetical protein